MNMLKFKGYFLIVVSGLYLIAAVVLLLLQWANKAAFSLYGQNFGDKQNVANGVSTLWLMLFSAIGGVVAAVMIGLLFKGISALRTGKRQEAHRQLEKRLSQMDKQPPAEPSNEG